MAGGMGMQVSVITVGDTEWIQADLMIMNDGRELAIHGELPIFSS